MSTNANELILDLSTGSVLEKSILPSTKDILDSNSDKISDIFLSEYKKVELFEKIDNSVNELRECLAKDLSLICNILTRPKTLYNKLRILFEKAILSKMDMSHVEQKICSLYKPVLRKEVEISFYIYKKSLFNNKKSPDTHYETSLLNSIKEAKSNDVDISDIERSYNYCRKLEDLGQNLISLKDRLSSVKWLNLENPWYVSELARLSLSLVEEFELDLKKPEDIEIFLSKVESSFWSI